MASLFPLPKENLLHCDIVGSLDIITCWFLCFFVHCVFYLSATIFWWIKLRVLWNGSYTAVERLI